MNCKPGDIAIVIRGPHFGHQFAVIDHAPAGRRFTLPNGVKHAPVGVGYWILESMSGGMRTRDGKWVIIGVGPDDGLMPIGDQPEARVDTQQPEENTA